MAGEDEPDELPDISEMVEVMRELVEAKDAILTLMLGDTIARIDVSAAYQREANAINAQRALLARIDAMLAQEFPG